MRSLVVLLMAGIVGEMSAHASPLGDALSLRAACLTNAAKLSAVRFDSRLTVQPLDAKAQVVGNAQQRTERVLWDKPGKRLKWANAEADPSAYAADARAGTLRLVNRAFSSTLTELPPERAEEYTTPFPGWLWHPERVVPAFPASVREEGAALVLVSSPTHPRREAWLDRATGVLTRFTDTDATGAVIRDVRCGGYAQVNGVWLPGTVDETIQGRRGGVRRSLVLDALAVNPSLSASAFTLP